MSLYVRLKIRFWNHRKTIHLKGMIGDAAFWVPLRLWCYAAEQQPDGDFSKYTATELAEILEYRADASSMLQALQESGFMEEMKIHNWHEHNSYHQKFSERASIAAKAMWKKRKEAKEKSTGTKKEIRKEKESKHRISMLEASVPDALNTQEFMNSWSEFSLHRKQIGHKLTPLAETKILKQLAERPSEAVAALETAIRRSWRGFDWSWIDKEKNNGTGHKSNLDKQRDRTGYGASGIKLPEL